jgi:hypothetical protein
MLERLRQRASQEKRLHRYTHPATASVRLRGYTEITKGVLSEMALRYDIEEDAFYREGMQNEKRAPLGPVGQQPEPGGHRQHQLLARGYLEGHRFEIGLPVAIRNQRSRFGIGCAYCLSDVRLRAKNINQQLKSKINFGITAINLEFSYSNRVFIP